MRRVPEGPQPQLLADVRHHDSVQDEAGEPPSRQLGAEKSLSTTFRNFQTVQNSDQARMARHGR